jgi:DNA-binding NtrC family response regulator
MSTLNEKSLRKYSSDLLSLQNHLLKAVKKQQSSEQVKEKEAIEILHLMNLRLSDNVKEFEPLLEELGGDTREEIKSKIANFTGTIAGLIDSARKDPVSKMLRDDYIALSMLAVGYKMLYTAALVAHRDDLAEITMSHLRSITQMITEISKAIPMVISGELIDDPELASEIGKKAVKQTQKAWSSEIVEKGPEVVEV